MTLTLSPQTPHKTSLFTSGLFAGTDMKPVMSWGKSSFGTGKKTLTISGQPVFRSGIFRDSMGIQTTWEDTHIDQMVFNYDHLVNTKVLEKVPVRKGHGSFFGDPMETLVGWHHSLSVKAHQSPVDGATYNYLLADYEIFDAEAAEHIFEGHWPNRSAEVGHYITNSEAEHWPVYQGFAFVDIPAVEGLNAFSRAIDPNKSSVSIFMEGSTVGTPPVAGETAEQKATREAAEAAAVAGTGGGDTEGGTPAATPPVATPPAEQPEAPVTPVTSDPVAHGAAGNKMMFQIGDKQTSDPAEVQAFINAQVTAGQEAVKVNRADFIKGLAGPEVNKIAATQIDSLTAFAQGLTPEQFTTWSASYEHAPALTLFEKHGADQGDNGGTPKDAVKVAEDEINTAKAVVSLHRGRNTSEAIIKKTESYQKLHTALPDKYPL